MTGADVFGQGEGYGFDHGADYLQALDRVDVNAMPLPEAAQRYAAHGCRVFPLAPRDKAAKLNGWQDKATTDPAQVRAWWESTPNANIGMLNGDRFDVVDLDGPDAEAAIRGRFGDHVPPVLGWVKTPHGWHGWIPTQGERRRVGVLPHVDYLGAGGYVVCAPSVVDLANETTGEVSTAAYRWVEPPNLAAPIDCSGWLALFNNAPETTPTTPLPLPVSAGGGTTSYGAAALRREAETVAATPEGARNDALNRAAFRVGRLVPHEVAEADARAALTEAARACGLPHAEAAATIRSGLTRGQTEPRYRAERPAPTLAWTSAQTPEGSRKSTADTGEVPADVAEGAGGTHRRLVLVRADTIKPRRVRWLWDGRLALGTLGLLAGREGLGKSTLGYWLAAQVTRGTLPGEYDGTQRDVLVCATEDSWAHTIIPRLIASGADLGRVCRVDVLTADNIAVGLTLPRDLGQLERAASETGAALLLLDPLMSRLDDRLDTYRDAEVRRALEPLVACADRAALAVVGVIHHNKSGSTDPLQLVMASKAFTAVARSVHTVIADPDDETGARRLFGTPKNNLGRTDLPTLAFTIEGFPVETEDGTAWTGRLNWGQESARSIGEVMQAAATDAETRTATDEAADWLEDYLQSEGGKAASEKLYTEGRKAGHTNDSLKRAKKRLRVSHQNEGYPRRTVWLLPDRTAPGEAPQTGSPSVRASVRASVRGESLTVLTTPTEPVSAVSAVSAPPRESAPTVHQLDTPTRANLTPIYPDALNYAGLCRLHPEEPIPGCYTCDSLKGAR